MHPAVALERLRRANELVALAVGVVLTLTALFILLDIGLRSLGRSLGGSDEVSGYAMAIAASWGLGYALMEGAHVRIDLLHRRVPSPVRALLDIAAMLALAVIVTVVAWYCWPVLEKSLERGSRANTPLETPLWIPQLAWFSGWLWFALTASGMLILAIRLVFSGSRREFDRWFAATDETASIERPPSTRAGDSGSSESKR